jgi:hypothetical protein
VFGRWPSSVKSTDSKNDSLEKGGICVKQQFDFEVQVKLKQKNAKKFGIEFWAQ